MQRIVARVILLAFVLSLAATGLATAGQLTPADAKSWMGEWALTIQGGRGPQESTLTIKEMGGKVVATRAGGRGNPIEITDITKKGDDVILKFKQQGRGGEVDVTLTLTMQADGTVKVVNQAGENKQEGTGKKKA